MHVIFTYAPCRVCGASQQLLTVVFYYEATNVSEFDIHYASFEEAAKQPYLDEHEPSLQNSR